jgi:hypothetical protein
LDRQASAQLDAATAANLRRLAEELARDQAELASVESPAGDIDLAPGRAAIAQVIAAVQTLTQAAPPKPRSPRRGSRRNEENRP